MENKTAEEILAKELNCKPNEIANYFSNDITIGMVLYCMKKFAEQERLKGIEEGFNAAREKELRKVNGKNYGTMVIKYATPTDYLNSKK